MVTQPGNKVTGQPGNKVTQPGNKVTQPGNKVTQPGNKVTLQHRSPLQRSAVNSIAEIYFIDLRHSILLNYIDLIYFILGSHLFH